MADERTVVTLLHDAIGIVRRVRIGETEVATLSAGQVVMQGQSTVQITLDGVIVQHDMLPGVEHKP